MSDSKKTFYFIFVLIISFALIISVHFLVFGQNASQTISSNKCNIKRNSIQIDPSVLNTEEKLILKYVTDNQEDNDSIISELHNRIERMEFYDEKQQQYENSLAKDKWYIGLLISIIGLFGIVVGLWGTISLKFSYDDKIKALDAEKDKTLKEFQDSSKKEFDAEKNKILIEFKDSSKKEFETEKDKILIELKNSSKKEFETEKDKILIELKNSSKKEFDEAISKYKEDLIQRKMLEAYQIGMKNFNEGKFVEALSSFDIAYKSKYLLEKTCYYLGMCYKKEGEFESALKYLQEAIPLNEDNLAYLKEILKEINGIIKDEKDKALSYFTDLYESSYCLETTSYLMGICYKYLNDKKSALLYLRQAESLNLNNPNLLSEIRKEINELEKTD